MRTALCRHVKNESINPLKLHDPALKERVGFDFKSASFGTFPLLVRIGCSKSLRLLKTQPNAQRYFEVRRRPGFAYVWPRCPACLARSVPYGARCARRLPAGRAGAGLALRGWGARPRLLLCAEFCPAMGLRIRKPAKALYWLSGICWSLCLPTHILLNRWPIGELSS
jgi:hypothetical protein